MEAPNWRVKVERLWDDGSRQGEKREAGLLGQQLRYGTATHLGQPFSSPERRRTGQAIRAEPTLAVERKGGTPNAQGPQIFRI